MENVTLTIEQANRILTYLGQRPYVEVKELIDIIVEGAAKKEVSSGAQGGTS